MTHTLRIPIDTAIKQNTKCLLNCQSEYNYIRVRIYRPTRQQIYSQVPSRIGYSFLVFLNKMRHIQVM